MKKAVGDNHAGNSRRDEECSCSTHARIVHASDASWNGKPYIAYPPGRPLLTVMKFTIPPHSSLPWHTHAMPNAGYVLTGSFTLEQHSTGKTRVVRAGEAFNESVDDIHRGYTTDAPTEIIVTYAGVQGLALSTPEPTLND